jgi:hypothetical protein
MSDLLLLLDHHCKIPVICVVGWDDEMLNEVCDGLELVVVE